LPKNDPFASEKNREKAAPDRASGSERITIDALQREVHFLFGFPQRTAIPLHPPL